MCYNKEPTIYGKTASEWADLYWVTDDLSQKRRACDALFELSTVNKIDWQRLRKKFETSKNVNKDEIIIWKAFEKSLPNIRKIYLDNNLLPLPLSLHKLFTTYTFNLRGPLCAKCLKKTKNKSVPSVTSTQLVGTVLYGKANKCDICGSIIQTHWFVIFMIPIIPLGSYRVIHNYSTIDGSIGNGPFLHETHHRIIGRKLKKPFFRHILISYSIIFSVILILHIIFNNIG